MKKDTALVTLIASILLVGILALVYILFLNTENADGVIGGERDEHGCLIPAGYSWNETEQECVREWETAKQGIKSIVFNLVSIVDIRYWRVFQDSAERLAEGCLQNRTIRDD